MEGLASVSPSGVQQAGGGGRVYSLVPSQSILALIFLNKDVAAFLPVRNTLWFPFVLWLEAGSCHGP